MTPIFDTDPDAIPRLRAKLDGLTDQRDRVAAYNRTCRKGAPDRSLLTDAQVRDLVANLRTDYGRNFACRGIERMPAYVSANLSGRIGEIRKRIERLSR